MNTTFTIERLHASQLSAVAEIERLCFAEPWSENALGMLLRDGAVGFAAIAVNEASNKSDALSDAPTVTNTVIAYGGMLLAPDDGQITNIAVHPDHRRKGAGRAILSALIAEAERLGLEQMSLEVRASNLAAKALYLSAGFAVAGIRKRFYRHPPEDALVMIRSGT